jgi:hypothetical protein
MPAHYTPIGDYYVNVFRRPIMPWIIVALSAVLISPLTQSLRAEVETVDEAIDDQDTTLLADAPAGEMKTVAVVAIAPYEELIKDINFLGTLAGKPELGQMVEGGLALFTQGKGPEALDKKKPWGLIAQSDGVSFQPVYCLPVKNTDDLLNIAIGFGAQLSDGDDGVKVLALPNEQTLYVKAGDGWTFVSRIPAALANLPAKPQGTFAKLLTEYDIAANLSMDNVPENIRLLVTQAMQAGMQQQLMRQDDETDDEFDARKQAAEAQMKQLVQMIDEIETLSVGWSIDAEQQRTFLDFGYFVKPDSKLDRQLAAYQDTRTNFAGFYQPDAAATATMAMQADPKLIEEDIEQFNAGMLQMRAQFNKAVDDNVQNDEAVRETIKTAADDWFDVLEATMKAGRFDAGAALRLSPDSLTLVAGAHAKEPKKVEDGLKKIEAAAKKHDAAKAPEIKWNDATHAGVTFHTVSVPIPEDLDAPRKFFGDQADIAVGIGPEAIYLAVGHDSLEAVKSAIDASAAQPEKAVPPFELAVSLAPLMNVAASYAEDDVQRVVLEKVADMLKNEAQGRDHIRMVGHVVPNGLRYRIEAEEGVLRGIGKATTEMQRQKLEAQQLGR